MMKIKLTIGRTSFQTDMRLIRIISIHNSKRLLQTKIVRLEEQEAQNSISKCSLLINVTQIIDNQGPPDS